MSKLLHTIWALLLNIFGFSIFRTCFGDSMEDEECESLLSGPPFSSVLFSLGVYMIIVNSTLFPRSFNKPMMIFIILYEFLAAAFILEFALACIWTPFDVLLTSTLPRNVSYIAKQLGFKNGIILLLQNRILTIALTYIVATTVFLLSLHVTDAVDYTLLRDCGVTEFTLNVQERLWERLQQEFPFLNEETKTCQCKARKRKRSKGHVNNSR